MSREVKKTAYVDLLSVVSMFFVVFVHASNSVFWNYSPTARWASANFIDAFGHPSVIMFFMISGLTLMDYQKRYTTKEYFSKRFFKTLLPYLIWSVVAIFWNVLFHGISLSSFTFWSVIDSIINNKMMGCYWFFIPMFLCYMAMPLFASVQEEKRRFVFGYLIIAGFVINILIPFLIKQFSVPVSFPYTFFTAASYPIYLLAGYWLGTYPLPKWVRWIIYALGVVGFLIHWQGTYYLSAQAGTVVDYYKSNMNLPVFITSMAVFLFFRQNGNKIMGTFVGKIMDFVKPYTFPVYLLHYYFIDALHMIPDFDANRLWVRLLSPFVIIPLCILISFVVRKIPVLKYILP